MVSSCFWPAEMDDALGQDGVEPVRQRTRQICQARRRGRPSPAARPSHPVMIVDEILPDRALKQPCVLQDHAEHADARPHVASRCVGTPSIRMLPPSDLIEAHQQVDHGGLARAGRADDRDLLTGCDMGGKVLDDDLIRRIRIAEADMLEVRLRPRTVAGGAGLSDLVGHLLAARGSRRCGAPTAEAVCIFVMPCAIWVSGEVNRRTYRMNATMTPKSMMRPTWPGSSRARTRQHSARLPTTFMSGCMMPDRNCERQFAS